MLSRRPSPLDRVGDRRHEPGLIDRLLADPRTRVVVTFGERVLICEPRAGSAAGLGYLTPDDARRRFGDVPGLVRASLGRGPDEVVLFALPNGAVPTGAVPNGAVPNGAVPNGAAEEGVWAGIRELLPNSDLFDAGVLTAALGLAQWHLSHGFCPACGSATEPAGAGWVRVCTSCGRQHFPRTDPAVIMAVLDERDRLLLGRQGKWPEGRMSVLAGFVETGETLEDAVRRETLEEVGVAVGRVEYQGSEPWPMPRSLMVGFRAQALTTGITVDGEELAEADWWTRDDVGAAYAAGRITLPGRMSIARRLIEQWYGERLPDLPDPR